MPPKSGDASQGFADHVGNWLKGAIAPLLTAAAVFFKENVVLGLWVLVPCAIVTFSTRKPLRVGDHFRLGWARTAVLVVYAAALAWVVYSPQFSHAAPLSGHQDVVPRNWMRLDRWGDWRYAVAKRVPETEIRVVYVDPVVDLRQIAKHRIDLLKVVANARAVGARGVAFDLTLVEESRLDPADVRGVAAANAALCRQIQASRKPSPADGSEWGVYFTYEVHGFRGEPMAWINSPKGGLPKDLRDTTLDGTGCIREADLGHPAAYRDADGVVRSVHLHLDRNTALPALSLRIAEAMQGAGKTKLPPDGLLQFVPPSNEFRTTTFAELGEAGQALRGQFVIAGVDPGSTAVGTHSDTWQPAWTDAPIPGVLAHAYAAHALLRGAWVRRAPLWVEGLLCPFLVGWALLARRRVSGRFWTTALAGAGAWTGAAAFSAGAMHFGLHWIDVSYLGAGLLTLLALDAVVTRIERARRPDPVPEPVPAPLALEPEDPPAAAGPS